MSQYRRTYIPGGIVFLTWITFNRNPLFADPKNIARLRQAVSIIRTDAPFEIIGAVILPDHIHFLWRLPSDDSNYSKRVGHIKVLFTKALRGNQPPPNNLSFKVRNLCEQ